MRLARFYTEAGRDIFTGVRFRTISDEDWFEYVVPEHWHEAAAGILKEKIFYPEALPAMTRQVAEEGVPQWLWRSETDTSGMESISAEWRYRSEKDIRDVLHRIAGALTYRAWKDKLFTAEEDAQIFYDELRHILLHQIAAPELRLWQKLGLNWAYGLPEKIPAVRRQTVSFQEETTQALQRIKILGATLALEEDAKATVTLPVENAASAAFISWKRDSDLRQVAESLGQRVLERAAYHVMDACDRESFYGYDPVRNLQLHHAVENAERAGLDAAAIRMAISYAEQGYDEISFPLHTEEKTPESCIDTVLSLPDDFIEAALTGHSYRHLSAPGLWNTLAEAVWASGAPEIFFRGTAESSVAPERAAQDAPAAVINLLNVAARGNGIVDIDAVQHVVRVMMIALDAAWTGGEEYRPLQLGMTNVAALLMGKRLSYDSDAGRAAAALVAGLVSGAACQASAEMAAETGAFPAYPVLAKTQLQNIKDKMALLSGTAFLQKGMTRRPVQIRTALCPDDALSPAAQRMWDEAYRLGKETGFRHAHLTGMETEMAVQALLGAQTQDIMPETALVRFEARFKEPYGKKLNPMVPKALAALGYTAAEINDIHFYAAGHGTLLDAPHINHKSLRQKGFPQAALDAVEAALTTAMHIRYVFNKWTLGGEFCRHVLGFAEDDLDSGIFDMLSALGFSEDQIEAANVYCCGTLSLEGAPHLKPAHLGIFDCIAPCGASAVRRVSPEAQVRMQASVEPFLSGAIAHTVLLGYHASIADVQKLILAGWELGVRRLKIYRDNCSLLQPLALPLLNSETGQEEEPPCHKQSMTA